MIAVLQRLDRLARNVWPFILSLLIVMVSVLPFYIPDIGRIAPNLAVMAVFYWAIYRPDLFPVVAAFALGLWQDLLVGSPLGINALVLLMVHWAVNSQRRFFLGKSFSVVWWAFAVIATGASILFWLLSAAYHATLVAPAPVAFQLLLTVGLYPFMTWLFASTQHAVLRQA